MFRDITRSLLAVMMLGSVAVSASNEWIDATHLFEEEVRAVVAGVERTTRSALPATAGTRARLNPAKVYKIGDQETFWTKNIVENAFEQTSATLKAIGKHCYIFVENDKNVGVEAIEKIRKSFDENIYPANTSNFGFEWKPGIDNDERITLLMFDIKDGYNGSGGFVGGYFYAVDSYLQEKLPPHLKSNEREMFYLDINPADPASDRYLATIAHEFQHMIHFNHDSAELTWVNEACSQIAPYLCGFGHANQVGAFMRTPDNSLTAWAKEQMLANYGQVYLWNYYIYSRFLKESPEARSMFFRNLVASKKQGIGGFIEALGKLGQSFTSTFDRFCLANYINDERLGKGEFAYDKSLARLKLPVSDSITAYPAEVNGEVFLWSADSIKFDLGSAREEIEIRFEGFRGKMGEDLTNTFSVALVMADSKGIAAPTISYMNVDYISSRLQGGTIKEKISKEHDTAFLVIIAQAMKYAVRVKDIGTAASGNVAAVNVAAEVISYAEIAGMLDLSNDAATGMTLSRLEDKRSAVAAQIVRELEQGNIAGIESVCDLVESEKVKKEDIRPLLNVIKSSTDFYFLQNPAHKLQEVVDRLTAIEQR
jgi:hypothetical protein